jgi:benzylsuccinate CoA-transferase BbsF subunit
MTQHQSALKGINVLDFTWAGAGPYATRFLGDFGARVIKVESRKRPDNSRVTPPYKDGIPHPDRSILFLHTNTSKLGITLNLQNPKGVEIAKRLVALVDIVVENFAPGVMERLGLSYEKLRKIKPDIIMASSSIYGQTGPKKRFAGFGNTGYAVSGHWPLVGWPDRNPVWPGIAYADAQQPIFTTIAILAAMDYRRRTGKGQLIDITQAETMVQLISPAMLDYFANGHVQTRTGNRSSYASPHGVFPCKGDDRWCAIAVFNELEWEALCGAMGHPESAQDARFTNLEARKEHEDELESMLNQWTSQWERDDLADLLSTAGVPSGPVQDGSDIVDQDPQLRERNCFVRLTHPVLGECNHPMPAVKFSRSRPQVTTSPCLGEHNEYVYKKFIGISDEEYSGLLSEGAFD